MPSGSTGAAGNKIPKGYAAGSLQQYDPEQMSLYKSLFGFAQPGGDLYERAMGSDKGFAPYEDYARRQFQEQTGEQASRFSGMGMGARRGSGFQNQATQGAQDFASNLAMQRQQLQRQALNDLRGLSGELLGYQPQENFLYKKEPKQSGWSKALGVGLPIAGAVAGGIFGGPAGAALGGQLGSTFASGFTGKGGGGSYEGISSLPSSWKPVQQQGS
jgi:hypothetical protein